MAAHVRVSRREGKAGSSERERGFSLSSAPAPLPSYDSLRDGNLRQYFETSSVQRLLQRSGWVDKSGRIVDLDKFKGKLNIIEQAPLLPSQHAGCFLPAALFQRAATVSLPLGPGRHPAAGTSWWRFCAWKCST